MAKFIYNELLDVWEEPQVYMGLTLYPVLMKDAPKFFYGVECLKLRKNRESDLKFFRMSYFEYLIFKIKEEVDRTNQNKEESCDNLLSQLIILFRLVLNNDSIDVQNLRIENEKPVFLINDVKLYTNHFDELRKIIFKQNMVQFDDDLSIDMENAINAKLEIDKRKNGEGLTFSEQIDKYYAITKTPRKEIKEMTLRSFVVDFKNQQNLKDFEVYTYPAMKSGQNIKHWLSSIKNVNPYEHLFMNGSQVENIKNV